MEIRAHIMGPSEYDLWDNFVLYQSQNNGSETSGGLGNIQQISDWGGFQQISKGEDWKWWIVGVFDDGKLIGGGMVLKRLIALRKSWLYVPKGPIFDYRHPKIEQIIGVWLAELEALAKSEQAVFLRVEPGLVKEGPMDFGNHDHFDWMKMGFRPAHAHYQPENTVIVDLKGSEEQILAQMKSKGRYNIRLAEKKGVQIMVAGEAEIDMAGGVREFCRLLIETTNRDGFSGHPEKYYLEMLKVLGPTKVKLYLASYESRIIAGIIVTFYGDLAIYYFGASSNQHRNVMAPYLLQWRAIQEAKERGLRWYDFLGTAPLEKTASGDYEYQAKHAWAGVTEFKLKFGGEKVDFYGGAEKIYNRIIYSAMMIKKKFRS